MTHGLLGESVLVKHGDILAHGWLVLFALNGYYHYKIH